MFLENNVNEIKGGERIYPRTFNEAALDHRERYHLALNYIKEGDQILDAATGVGYGAYYMAVNSNCETVVGIDINKHAVEWARKYFSSSKNFYTETNLLEDFSIELPFQSFDVVTCFETIEHLKEDKAFLKRLQRLLKPGGVLLISSPNEEVIPCLENPFYPDNKNPHHHRHYTPSDLKEVLRESGFSILEAYTQCPNQIVKGENGFVIIYVCTNLPETQTYAMNSIEKGVEKLSIMQMRKTFSFLQNNTSFSMDFTSIHQRIDEILYSGEEFMTAYQLVQDGKLQEALNILNQIDKSLCPESYFLMGLIYQAEGYAFKAMELYSKLLDNKEYLNPVIIKLAEEQLVGILNNLRESN